MVFICNVSFFVIVNYTIVSLICRNIIYGNCFFLLYICNYTGSFRKFLHDASVKSKCSSVPLQDYVQVILFFVLFVEK